MTWLTDQLNRLDDLSLRERAMIGGTALLLIGALIFLFAIEPAGKKRAAAQLELGEITTQTAQLQATLTQAINQAAVDPDQTQRERIAQLTNEITAVEAQLNNEISQIVPPQKMRDLLASMLQSRSTLTLVQANNLPAEPIVIASPVTTTTGPTARTDQASADVVATEQPQAAAEQTTPAGPAPSTANAPLLYRHAVDIVFDGDYQSAIDYLRDVEKMPIKPTLSLIELDAEKYPVIRFRLRATTLSLKRGVIGV